MSELDGCGQFGQMTASKIIIIKGIINRRQKTNEYTAQFFLFEGSGPGNVSSR